jgi:thiol-disulfide isomerase/thioredoxin
MMKQTLLIYFFILLFFPAYSQPVHFESSLQEAFKKAAVENKPVFIEYYNSLCTVCHKLEPLFSDAKLGEFYNTHFVNYKLNTEGMKTEDSLFMVRSKLKFTGVPYFLFFDAGENFLHYSDTKPEVDFLVEAGTKALNPDERVSGLELKYKNGDRSIKTLYAFSLLTQLYKNDSLSMILADDLFKAFPANELGSRKSYIITKNCVKSIENGFFKFWIQHMDKLEGLETEKHKGEEKKILAEIVRLSVYSKAGEQWNLEKINEVKKYIVLTGLSNDGDAFFWQQESTLLAAQKRYAQALDIGRQMLDTEKVVKARLSIIRHFLNILNSGNELKTVKQWKDEMALKIDDISDKGESMYLDALYYTKTNQKKQAVKTINEALEFYKKNNLETGPLTDLINTR